MGTSLFELERADSPMHCKRPGMLVHLPCGSGFVKIGFATDVGAANFHSRLCQSVRRYGFSVVRFHGLKVVPKFVDRSIIIQVIATTILVAVGAHTEAHYLPQKQTGSGG